nr:hypothetical protein [uncultured Caulobacter sp.]
MRLLGRSGLSTAPLASATSVAQLEELMGAARLELPGEVWKRLDEAGRA